MTLYEMNVLAAYRRQDAAAAKAAADTAYTIGRYDGAMRAHAAIVRLATASARRDLDVARRNRLVIAAASA